MCNHRGEEIPYFLLLVSRRRSSSVITVALLLLRWHPWQRCCMSLCCHAPGDSTALGNIPCSNQMKGEPGISKVTVSSGPFHEQGCCAVCCSLGKNRGCDPADTCLKQGLHCSGTWGAAERNRVFPPLCCLQLLTQERLSCCRLSQSSQLMHRFCSLSKL